MATDKDTTIPLHQLLFTHEKVCNLKRAPLSEPVLNLLRSTAHDLVLEMGMAPAKTWDELIGKLRALLDDYTDSYQFVDIIADDIGRLTNTMVVQAAE